MSGWRRGGRDKKLLSRCAVPKKSHLRKQQADLIDDIPNDYSLNDVFIGLSELK